METSHIHTKASGSFQLDAAYTNQRPGSRRGVGGVTPRSLASASLYGLHVRKIITASFCLTEEEFLSAPPESSGWFEPHFLLVTFDTETLFFSPTQHKHGSRCCLAGAAASSKKAAKHTLGLCDEYYKNINHNPY